MAFGVDRLARRMLEQARDLRVPTFTVVDEPVGRVELFRRAVGEPDAWQIEVLESEKRKLLLLCSRQSGKSTVSATLAVHEAASRPGSLVLMLAPALRQSGELFRKCLAILRTPDAGLPSIVKESALRAELENGSRLVALPGSEKTTRGYSAARLVILDEAARIPDELISAVRPMLATTNGRIVALSTPAGKRGWFFLEHSSGQGWQKTRVTAEDCPRISAEFLEDELRSLGEWVYEQEYGCEFYDPETSVFSSALIERALSGDVAPLWEVAA